MARSERRSSSRSSSSFASSGGWCRQEFYDGVGAAAGDGKEERV